MYQVYESDYTIFSKSSYFTKPRKNEKGGFCLTDRNKLYSNFSLYFCLNLSSFLIINSNLSLKCQIFPEKIMALEENWNNSKNLLILELQPRNFSTSFGDDKKMFTKNKENHFFNNLFKFSKRFYVKKVSMESKIKKILDFCFFRNSISGNILKGLFYKNWENDLKRNFSDTKLFEIDNKKIYRVENSLTCFYLNFIFTRIILKLVSSRNQNYPKKFIHFLKKKFNFSLSYILDDNKIITNKTLQVNFANQVQKLLSI
jgi:hypothetical protein